MKKTRKYTDFLFELFENHQKSTYFQIDKKISKYMIMKAVIEGYIRASGHYADKSRSVENKYYKITLKLYNEFVL